MLCWLLSRLPDVEDLKSTQVCMGVSVEPERDQKKKKVGRSREREFCEERGSSKRSELWTSATSKIDREFV